MNKTSFQWFAMVAIALLSLQACKNNEGNSETLTATNDDSLLTSRGEYLVSIMGCDDCHSPKNMTPQGPELDMAHRLSGYPAQRALAKINPDVVKNGWVLFDGDLTAAVGPWGASFSANLTGDSTTGLGNWTEEQFKIAMTQGKAKGLEKSRDLLPPMPWQNFSHLHDEDIKAIFAYLKSLPHVKNVVPQPKTLSEL
ncbi:MAG: c-type cytochrome [Ginsengibacter sp.]